MQDPELDVDADDIPTADRRVLDGYGQVTFLNRTHAFFQDQKRRAKAKGERLDYRLEDLRYYVQNNLGDRHCNFCCGAVTPESFAVVQRNPLERGGGLGFHNLVVVCDTCGAAKGSLDHFEYRELMYLLRTWAPSVRDYFLGRLGAGVAPRITFPQPGHVIEPPLSEEPDFDAWCSPPMAREARSPEA